MGLVMELQLDDLMPSKKVIKIQIEPIETPGIVARAMAGLRGMAPAGAADPGSSPNPIYDSPPALALLYDEIWFLCKSLCPASMRDLPFVHYVLEENGTLVQDFSYNEDADFEFLSQIDSYVNRREFFDNYNPNIFSLGAKWWRTKEPAIDNHSHRLNLPLINDTFAAAQPMLGVRYWTIGLDGQFTRLLTNDVPIVDSIVLHELPKRLAHWMHLPTALGSAL